MLAPGLVMGIMILPYTASVSEDAMRAVPSGLREAGYALGYSRFRVATHVVVPAALSGITAAFILGMSRAVGETMVVIISRLLKVNRFVTWLTWFRHHLRVACSQ